MGRQSYPLRVTTARQVMAMAGSLTYVCVHRYPGHASPPLLSW